MDKKNKIIVTINGREYTIIGNEDPKYIQKVAQYVDEKMRLISKRNPTLSENRLSVLTSINLVDDFFKEKKSINPTVDAMEELEMKLQISDETIEQLKAQILDLSQSVENLKGKKV